MMERVSLIPPQKRLKLKNSFSSFTSSSGHPPAEGIREELAKSEKLTKVKFNKLIVASLPH